MAKLSYDFTGRLYFENVSKKDVKEIVEHLMLHVGVTGNPTYLKDSKTLCVTVCGEGEVPLSVMDFARNELEIIRRMAGAKRCEVAFSD